jgi:hypothetical protein
MTKTVFKRFWRTGMFGCLGSTNYEAMRKGPINKGLLKHRSSASRNQKIAAERWY